MAGYKTYLGLIVALLPTMASLIGYDVVPSFSDDFPKLAEEAVTIIGLCIAFYGRAVATVPGWFAKKKVS